MGKVLATREIELKLQCNPEQLTQIAKYLNERFEKHEKRHVISIYYDTPDLLLLKDLFILRVREVAGQYIQTIKTANKSEDGIHDRQEWETPVAKLTPDLSKLPEEIINQFPLEKLTQLKPIFTTDFIRDAYVITLQNSEAEIALDRGKIIMEKLQEEICECEIEFKKGDLEIIHLIKKNIQQLVPVTLENKSKAERGFDLYLQQQ